MLLLNAVLSGGELLLWGEVAPEPGERPKVRRGSPKMPRLIGDAGPGRLTGALAEVLAGYEGKQAPPVDRVIWLPAIPGGDPIPSSPLIAAWPAPGAVLELTPRLVTTIPLARAAMITLLCAIGDKDAAAPGVIVGSSLAFWSVAMRFAGSLVAREQFLPAVESQGDSFRAVWQPVIGGQDTGRAAVLSRSMPAACRAMVVPRSPGPAVSDSPPDSPASSVLAAFLELACDELVRASAISSAPEARRVKIEKLDSIHEQWMHALRSADGTLPGAPADLNALAAQIEEWRRPVTVTTSSPFRLTFRLEEPSGADSEPGNRREAGAALGGWYVRFLLQAADDPSLLIPAETAWTAKGKGSQTIRRSGFQPREYLLAALGHAARMDSQIEASLKTAAPAGYSLDTAAAHTFLTQTAWMLEASGYGVLLPAWWTRKGTKLRLSARASVKTPSMQSSEGLSLDTIVKFDWQVALGGQALTMQELEALAEHKAPLVKVRGQWVEVSAEEIQTALEFWKKHPQGQGTVREVVRMSLGGGAAPAGLEFDGVTASGWMEDFLTSLKDSSTIEDLPPPFGLRATLRPYQQRGYSWLSFLQQWGLGACLADDMGLGKTVQVLSLIQRLRTQNSSQPVLVVCPMSVVGNWQKEAARFTPDLPVLVHHGADRLKGAAFKKAAGRHAIVLSSFALIHRDLDLLKEVPWAGTILDEAQNIKNPETRTAKAARALPGGFRIALTGTPVENHVGDLWSVMEFLNPGFLGTQTEFKRTFFVPIQAERDPEAAEALKRVTGPFILRRLKTDRSIIADLPDKMEMKVFCSLTREQASLYEAVVRDAEEKIADSEGMQRRGLVLATLLRLKQLCNHPAQFLADNSALPGRSGKLARLTEMLEEALDGGDRALIFSQFTEMGEMIRRHLQSSFGQEVLFLHGGTPKKQRDQMVERFQSGEGPRVFILSLKAGGTGLNLTAANHVFHFDRWWNPAVENQATDRAFRIGQRKNVQVHKFLCTGTLEEKIDEMIENKRAIAADVVGTGESWITELSTDDLKDLFRLRADAVGE